LVPVLEQQLERAFREHWGRVLATLIGLLGDFDRAERAAQEAYAIAAERWPADGIPDNPSARLITTGRRRAIDRIRREQTLATAGACGRRRAEPRPSARTRWPASHIPCTHSFRTNGVYTDARIDLLSTVATWRI
jgi:predicted RNA polymerase sigma factor